MSSSSPAAKSCPYCGESVLAVALKCKHCGEFLDGRRERRIGVIDSAGTSAMKAALLATAAGMAYFAYALIRNVQSVSPMPVRFSDFAMCVIASLIVLGAPIFTFLRWRAHAKRNAK